MRFERVI